MRETPKKCDAGDQKETLRRIQNIALVVLIANDLAFRQLRLVHHALRLLGRRWLVQFGRLRKWLSLVDDRASLAVLPPVASCRRVSEGRHGGTLSLSSSALVWLLLLASASSIAIVAHSSPSFTIATY